jgi:hypothetical protein
MSGSALRRELLLGEPVTHDGMIEVSDKPGLGVELNRDALERYRVPWTICNRPVTEKARCAARPS